MILVLTKVVDEHDKFNLPTGNKKLLAYCGVDMKTYEKIILPLMSPTELGAEYNPDYDSWYIEKI